MSSNSHGSAMHGTLSFVEYLAEHKKLQSERSGSQKKKALKIALLSSFTTTGIKEVLSVKCFDAGVATDFYEASYNQFAQEILNADGALYQFKADVTILFIDIMNLLGDDFFFPYRLSDDDRKKVADVKCEEVFGWVKMLIAKGTGKVLLHNFRVPYYSPMGILENKQKFGFFEMVKRINERLADEFKNNSQIFVFNYDGFCSKHGKASIMDNKMYYLGDFKLRFDFIPFLCKEYMAYIKPLASLTRKCLVLDLDNTLWGGVIGEDGMEGIKLGPTPEGRPFLEFQKYILNLFERGVILAINSSNNPEDVEKALREHPNMILKKEHFAAMEINWNDKISNMRSIAGKINIGLDSLVFLDDLRSNRELVRLALPEVLVPELPEDPAEYLTALMELDDFNVLQLTAEDKNRNRLYALDQQRHEHRANSVSITDYLKDLKIVVTLAQADLMTVPRISQLTQKTNQFNMTTRRYQEEDIKSFSEDEHFRVFSVKVEDRFGDSGITGALVIERQKDVWRIDTFLLSCRVIGKKIEQAVLGFLIGRARKEHVRCLRGEFRPTEKNMPATSFYKNSGFSLKNELNGEETWERDVSIKYDSPDFIEVLWRG
jgi:FkbH-like protein